MIIIVDEIPLEEENKPSYMYYPFKSNEVMLYMYSSIVPCLL